MLLLLASRLAQELKPKKLTRADTVKLSSKAARRFAVKGARPGLVPGTKAEAGIDPGLAASELAADEQVETEGAVVDAEVAVFD